MKTVLNRFTRCIAILCILTYSVYVNAAEVEIKINDFAYGMEIQTKNKQAIQASLLPAHFYENIRNPTLSDFRVFDARGQVMPAYIKKPNIDTSKSETKILDFYPIHAPKGKNLDALSLSLDRDNSKLSVVIDDAQQTEDQGKLIAYIIENNQDIYLESLNFEWSKPETGFIRNVRLEQSSDLIHWSTLKNQTSLARLQHQNRTIGNNTIHVRINTKQFLRLSWNTNNTEFVITKVSANYKQKSQKNVGERPSLKPILQRISDTTQLPIGAQRQSVYAFTLPGYFPVNEIEINSTLDNYHFQARLLSRRSSEPKNEKQHRWVEHGKIEQYHLAMDDQVLKSVPQDLRNIKRNEWLLAFIEPQKVDIPPEVKMTWQPEYLVFLAKGKSPYTLAYGNPTIRGNKANISEVINQLSENEWQSINSRLNPLIEPKELGGPQKLLPPPAAKPWRTIILWVALVLGVLAMGWMAFRLIKDTKTKV